MFDDLHRPLGRHLIRTTAAIAAPRHDRAINRLGVGALLLAVASSAGIAWMQPGLRTTDVFAERAALEAQSRAADAAAAENIKPRIFAAARPLPAEAPVERFDPAGDALPTITYPPGEDGRPGTILTVTEPGSFRQSPDRAHVPDDDLIETGADGPLPVRAADGRRPFDVYSVAPPTGLGTRVAIVVGGLGISQTGTEAAIETLPPAVTLAFAPSGNSLDRWMQSSRRSGHELLLQLPMEPFGYPNATPGENTVTAAAASAGDFTALHASLARLTNYVGVVNYMGARLSSDPAAMRGLIGEIAARGLLYLDDGSSTRSLAKDTAEEAGAVLAASDVLIDGDSDPQAIAKQLDTLERVARADGTAIGVASAFEGSVGAIAAWAVEAERRGIRIVPISALADDPEAR